MTSDSNLPIITAYPVGVDPIANADMSGAQEFIKNLHQRSFLLRDVGISSYLFNQWKKYGLIDIPISAQSRKWVMLNFGEFIWLKIINDLRKLGCPLEDIKKIKERYMIDPFQQMVKLNGVEIFHKMLWDALKQHRGQTEEQFNEMKKEFSQKSPMDLLREVLPRQTNLFESCILNMMVTRSEAYLVLFLTDYFPNDVQSQVIENISEKVEKRKRVTKLSTIEFGLFSDEFKRIDPNSEYEKVFEVPHIKLPLRVYIKDFISDRRNEKHLENLGILTENEMILLKEVRRQGVEEITIKFKNTTRSENSKIERIEVTEKFKKVAETRLIETFTNNEYAEITYHVEKGNIVNFKKTLKIKMRN